MSSTDLTGTAAAVSRIQIDGPGMPAVSPTGRVELTEETLTRVLPGEIDAAVGSQPQPEPEEGLREHPGYGEELHEIEVAADGSFTELRSNGDALFDPHAYDTTPVLDGQSSDVLKIGVGGGVTLEASDEDAQALFTALRLGKFVSIRAEGFVSQKSGGYSENKDGESKVTGKATVKITDLRLLRPEELA